MWGFTPFASPAVVPSGAELLESPAENGLWVRFCSSLSVWGKLATVYISSGPGNVADQRRSVLLKDLLVLFGYFYQQ